MSLMCSETSKYKHFFTPPEYKDYRTALTHVLTNLARYGGRLGALLLRFQIINDKRVSSFILSDCGEGFVDIGDDSKRVGNAPIHEAVKERRSLGWPGTTGCALTQTATLADHISITPVDRIGGESHACYWEKGFSSEQFLELALVENGTKILFVKEMPLSETTITSNRHEENKTENKQKRQEFTRRQILKLVIASLIPGKNIAQAKTTIATTKRLEKEEHRVKDSKSLKS